MEEDLLSNVYSKEPERFFVTPSSLLAPRTFNSLIAQPSSFFDNEIEWCAIHNLFVSYARTGATDSNVISLAFVVFNSGTSCVEEAIYMYEVRCPSV